MEQDWAQLKYYQKENQEILKSFNCPDVVFIGNSITEGWAKMHPDFFHNNNYLGRGIGGQTTPQMLIRFTPDVLDLNPKAVVILAGTNDIAGNTGFSSVKMVTDNIKAMALLAEQKKIKVILCSVLPVCEYPWRPEIEPVIKVDTLNSWIENFAEKHGFIYVDFFSPMANYKFGLDKDYSEDGVHPNEKGYEVMEPLVQAAIEKALAD
ncbi:SGNH/GDSL hydrolase family protein [Gramella jeungdoensis]|uniref:SGNH/GDSL hydrolase family protein n=1 Tax=Gramella jeungdoensis TaxID=708091 RepID=A0ABT0Z780_9FLAO|nr:SGNH/GDSL hydrolase family protein [Gramella jeungdoensis]MCM8570629.1 SGNH/GDSL hydrolase family protein [Gramella jeungdoensis]